MDNRWALILLVLLVFSMIRARPARWPAHPGSHRKYGEAFCRRVTCILQ
jgi:hypothetical protein